MPIQFDTSHNVYCLSIEKSLSPIILSVPWCHLESNYDLKCPKDNLVVLSIKPLVFKDNNHFTHMYKCVKFLMQKCEINVVVFFKCPNPISK